MSKVVGGASLIDSILYSLTGGITLRQQLAYSNLVKWCHPATKQFEVRQTVYNKINVSQENRSDKLFPVLDGTRMHSPTAHVFGLGFCCSAKSPVCVLHCTAAS